MKYFIETSVLLTAAIPGHENNLLATELLVSCKEKGELVCLSTHVLTEMYSNLTKLVRRVDPKFSLKSAVTLIKRTVSEMQTVELSEQDYYAAMARCTKYGLSGGIIYDALHYQAALKAGATVLYTDNLKDFNRLADGSELLIKGIRKK